MHSDEPLSCRICGGELAKRGSNAKGGGLMTLYARVTTDGYLLYAATDDEYTACDSYWPDYYSDEFADDEVNTLGLTNVPDDLAADLCKQGTSEQVYSDGYEAWQAAAPYATEGSVL